MMSNDPTTPTPPTDNLARLRPNSHSYTTTPTDYLALLDRRWPGFGVVEATERLANANAVRMARQEQKKRRSTKNDQVGGGEAKRMILTCLQETDPMRFDMAAIPNNPDVKEVATKTTWITRQIPVALANSHPMPSGLDGWMNILVNCVPDEGCVVVHIPRIEAQLRKTCVACGAVSPKKCISICECGQARYCSRYCQKFDLERHLKHDGIVNFRNGCETFNKTPVLTCSSCHTKSHSGRIATCFSCKESFCACIEHDVLEERAIMHGQWRARYTNPKKNRTVSHGLHLAPKGELMPWLHQLGRHDPDLSKATLPYPFASSPQRCSTASRHIPSCMRQHGKHAENVVCSTCSPQQTCVNCLRQHCHVCAMAEYPNHGHFKTLALLGTGTETGAETIVNRDAHPAGMLQCVACTGLFHMDCNAVNDARTWTAVHAFTSGRHGIRGTPCTDCDIPLCNECDHLVFCTHCHTDLLSCEQCQSKPHCWYTYSRERKNTELGGETKLH